MLRYGSDARLKRRFHPLVQSLFHRLVIDPQFFLRCGFSRENLCIPASVLLCLHARLGGSPIRKLNIAKMEAELKALNFRSLLKMGVIGLSLNQIGEFESLNSNPIPSSLLKIFPALSMFNGIAVNAYIARRNESEFRLFPFSLSKHSRDSAYFQADILVESPDIRPADSQVRTPSQNSHCLAISNLVSLVTKFSKKASNSSKYRLICRTCLKVFSDMKLKLVHEQSGCAEKKRGCLGRRKSKNQLIHRPYIKNQFTGKIERNGLRFRRGHSYKLLRPLSLGKIHI